MAAEPTAWAGSPAVGGHGEPWSASTSGPLNVSRLCLGTMLMGGRTPADEAPRLLDAYVAAGPQLPRHRRHLRRRHLGADARAVARAPARRGRGRDQAALRRVRPRRRGAGARARRARRATRRCGAWASTSSTSTRCMRPTWTSRWRTRWSRSTGSCARARCAPLAPRTSRPGCWPGRSASRIARASPPSSRCSRSTRWSSARSRPRSCPSAAPRGWACCRGGRSGRASSPAATRATRRRRRARASGTPSDDLEEAIDRRGTEANFRAVDEARAVADELGATIAQVALAWLLAQPGVTAPIVGPRTLDQLEDLLPAAELALDDEQVARLGRWTAPALGYPERMLVEQSDIDVAASACGAEPLGRPLQSAETLQGIVQEAGILPGSVDARRAESPARIGPVIGGTAADAWRRPRGRIAAWQRRSASREPDSSPRRRSTDAPPEPPTSAAWPSPRPSRCCPSPTRRPSPRCTTAIAGAPWPSSSARCTSATTASSGAARCTPSSASSAATG